MTGVTGGAKGAALVFALAVAGPSWADNVLEAACKITGGPGVSRAFCSCMQQIADLSLTMPEQKLAAAFLRDPVQANRIRQRNPANRHSFWARYDSFEIALRRHCIGWP